MPALAFSLQPSKEFLDRIEPLLHRVDLFEATPETLWFTRANGETCDNSFLAMYRALGDRFRKPFIAHGVAISPCSVGDDAAIAARRDAIVANVARVHAALDFRWYTDHFGACLVGGDDVSLHLPAPPTDDVLVAARASLAAMRRVVPSVGFENSVTYFHLADPLDEATFLGRAVDVDGGRLLLDLHNVHTMAVNAGFDPRAWIARLPLERVIEIHVSGGKDSDPAWLKDRAVMRLDSHDDAVPEAVFELLEWTLPKCPNLEAVTLERMEGTVEDDDVPLLEGEIRRLREMIR